MSINMKGIDKFTQGKIWISRCDIHTREHLGASTHPKHHAMSGPSTRSAVDIFNTLRVFTHEPIREQEIK